MTPTSFARLAFVVLSLALVPLVAAGDDEGPVRRTPEKTVAVQGKAVKVQLALTGMTCQGCAQTIASLLTTIEGVISAEVDLKTKRAEVAYDDARVKPERLLKKIQANGYGATVVPAG